MLKRIGVVLHCVVFIIINHQTKCCPPMCTCDYYAAVHTINCESQDLSEIPAEIPEWTTELNFDGNYLSVLNLTVFNVTTYYEEFRIRYNEITSIIPTNHPRANRAGLRGACNHISAMFPRLLKVNLRGNLLNKLPKCLLSSWPVLKVLNLAENQFKSIRDLNFADHVSYSDSLEELSINRNQIGRLTRSELYTPSNAFRKIKVLDISENTISHIDAGVFMFMHNLEEIKLGENQVSVLPNYAFTTSGHKVQAIQLNQNRIEMIENLAFAGLPALTTLNLRDNAIQCLQSASLATCTPSPPLIVHSKLDFEEMMRGHAHLDLAALTRLNIQGNRWRCNCNLSNFIQNSRIRRITNPLDSLPCENPIRLRGYAIRRAMRYLDECNN